MLRSELGLTDRDEVHRLLVSGGETETVRPAAAEIPVGAWVEFLSDDWQVHEIRFELDSLGAEARAFLEETDQVASPPLVSRGARFVVSFADAPAGRYPFVLEGNRGPGRGVVVVRASR